MDPTLREAIERLLERSPTSVDADAVRALMERGELERVVVVDAADDASTLETEVLEVDTELAQAMAVVRSPVLLASLQEPSIAPSLTGAGGFFYGGPVVLDPAASEAARRALEAKARAFAEYSAKLLARLRLLLAGAAVPALVFLLGFTLIVLVPVGFAIALKAAFSGVNPALLLVAGLAEAFCKRLLEELDYGLDDDEVDCFNKCVERFLTAIINAFLANAAFGAFPRNGGKVRRTVASLLLEAVLAFEKCLLRCGIKLSRKQLAGLWPLLVTISEVLFGFNGLGPGGQNHVFNSPLRKRVRNGLRDLALDDKRHGDLHRRGGFGFGEFDDDRTDNPDITDEDTTADVDLADLTIDPTLALDGFTNKQLKRRKEALERFLKENRRDIKALRDAYKKLPATPDNRFEQEKLGRAIEEAVRQGRRLRAALRNALIECIDRADLAGKPKKAAKLRKQARKIKVFGR